MIAAHAAVHSAGYGEAIEGGIVGPRYRRGLQSCGDDNRFVRVPVARFAGSFGT